MKRCFYRKLPYVIRVKGMAHVVFCGTVCAAEVVWILRVHGTPSGEAEKAAIRDFV